MGRTVRSGATRSPAWKPATRRIKTARRTEIRRENERLILDAAERVFAEAGFGGATMQLIADMAGLPKANLHYYFGSKAVLYQAVLARTLRDWLLLHCL